MFTIRSTDKTKTFKAQTYKPGARIPVFAAASLLANKHHQFLLQRLSEICKLSRKLYELLYEGFTQRFVEFVQVLPTQNNDPLCGLMNDGLMRGINSLDHLLRDHNDAPPLERYAVFTAAVLKNVANVVVNQKIFITDEQGATIKEWRPFSGSLAEDDEAEYYKIIPLSLMYQRVSHAITPLLARQLLPEKGFSWLTSDMRIFVDWLDALRGDDGEGGGRIVHTVQLYRHGGIETSIDSLPAVNFNLEESPATHYADSFFAWLKEALANGQIKVNTADAGVHVTQQGVFIEIGAFKQFIDLHVNVPVNMFAVYQQFGNLFGLTKLSGIDYRVEQLFSEYPDFAQNKNKGNFVSPLSVRTHQIRDGVMIRDAGLIFMNGEAPAVTPYLKSLPAAQRAQNLPKIVSDQSGPKQQKSS